MINTQPKTNHVVVVYFTMNAMNLQYLNNIFALFDIHCLFFIKSSKRIFVLQAVQNLCTNINEIQ